MHIHTDLYVCSHSILQLAAVTLGVLQEEPQIMVFCLQEVNLLLSVMSLKIHTKGSQRFLKHIQRHAHTLPAL